MPKRLREEDLVSIVDVARQRTDGARRSEIAQALKDVPQRTLQYWLKSLVEDGRLIQEGKGPAARYRLPAAAEKQKETAARQAAPGEEKPEEAMVPLSAESKKIHEYLRQPSEARKAVDITVSFSTAIDPTRVSICHRKRGRNWRSWAGQKLVLKRPALTRSRFSTACSSTCHGTQAAWREILFAA